MVELLVGLRADVNAQANIGDLTHVGRLLFAGKMLQQKFGQTSIFAEYAYHLHGRTHLALDGRNADCAVRRRSGSYCRWGKA